MSAVVANQEHKRAQIVEAARAVLARDGLAGATARTIADASPLTKSAIHYYFADVDEIVDLAMAAHVAAMLDGLRELAGQHIDPAERVRAVLTAYLGTFVENPPAAFLWFEYWIAAGRRGDTAAVDRMLTEVEALVAELLPAAADARVIVSWLLGAVVQQHVRPRSATDLAAEIDVVLRPL